MPIRSTNGSRPGRGGAAIADWLSLQAPGADGEIRPVYVDGELCVARFTAGAWTLVAPSAPAQAFAAANAMPPGSTLPLLADYTYIAPGGIWNFESFPEAAALNLAFAPADGDCEFTNLEFTFWSTSGTGYEVVRLYVGPLSGSAVTGNYATGYVPVVTSPLAVPAGTSTAPGYATVSVSVPGSGAFAIVVELSAGAESSVWTQQYLDVDYNQLLLGREARMAVLPSSGTFNVASTGSTFARFPNMSIKVSGLSKPWATIAVPGDSHAGAYDSGNFNERRGVPWELSELANTDGVPVTFLPLGYDGLNTLQIATRWEALLAGPLSGLRGAILPAFSVNNFGVGRTAAQAQQDYLDMEAAFAPQPSIPGFWGVNNAATAPQWATQRAVWDWHLVRRPDSLDDHLGYIVDGTTGLWISPYGSGDGGHETVAGQTLHAQRWWPSVKTWLAGLGVAA
jgi:hypothetical protein